MKKISTLLILLCAQFCIAQTNSTIQVNGDFDKFYPVIFTDPGWAINQPTKISITRSDIHTNSLHRGSLVAIFQYHTTNWGHGSHHINAWIKNYAGSFIAGWDDATRQNGSQQILIWLRGGGTSYYLNSELNVQTIVFDGVQNSLPFLEINGPQRTYKTSIDDYVNSNGLSVDYQINNHSSGNHYFAGSFGIGTKNPDEKLTVKGKIHAEEVKVDLSVPGPDYVFNEDYKLTPLSEIQTYIKTNKHLPEIPSAEEMEKNGINLSEMNMLLLKKVEELTLHLIEKEKQVNSQIMINKNQQNQINDLNKNMNEIKKKMKVKLSR